MKTLASLIAALALALPAAAHAANEAETAKCCCCEKMAQGESCCDKMKQKPAGEHGEHAGHGEPAPAPDGEQAPPPGPDD